jgi:hypothetical protein
MPGSPLIAIDRHFRAAITLAPSGTLSKPFLFDILHRRQFNFRRHSIFNQQPYD